MLKIDDLKHVRVRNITKKKLFHCTAGARLQGDMGWQQHASMPAHKKLV